MRQPRGTAAVLRAWRDSTPAERAHGERWYQEAHAVARVISDANGKSLETVVGIIAVLSPSVRWEHNVRFAEELVETGGIKRYNGYGANVEKAVRILDGETLEQVTTERAYKVRAFYRLILTAGQDRETVCVDSHARNVLDGKVRPSTEARPIGSLRQYTLAAEAYRAVARRVRKPAHVVQAATWLRQKRLLGADLEVMA